jgi:hypothetical protein
MPTTPCDIGRAVDKETIEALPLSNRNYTQILSLSPGVVVELPNAAALGRGTQNVTANGNKTTSNNIQFNGIDANNLSQNSAASDGEEVGVAAPAPDTIEEFKVQTGAYSAEYGRSGGGERSGEACRSAPGCLHRCQHGGRRVHQVHQKVWERDLSVDDMEIIES